MIKKMMVSAACLAMMSLPALAQTPAPGGMQQPSGATSNPGILAPGDASETGVRQQNPRQRQAKVAKRKKTTARHNRKPQRSAPDASDGMGSPQQ